VAGECARGVQDVQLSTRVPIIFGVLTTNTVEQALERSQDDESNKGREAALTALAMVNLLRQGSLARP
jgi:6,7-dimethyl-8-ribityllumazine synthase